MKKIIYLCDSIQPGDMKNSTQIHSFQTDISSIALPRKFPYLYTHEPHSLCRIASEELQKFLLRQTTWNEYLGLDGKDRGIGKMFGVLVVQQTNGKLAYLAAFSGAIGTCNTHPYFVPPIFNLLDPNGFFKQGEQKLSALNKQIEQLEQDESLTSAQLQLHEATKNIESTQSHWKEHLKNGKKIREGQREDARKILIGNKLDERLEELNRASQLEKIAHKKHIVKLNRQIELIQESLNRQLSFIASLKKQRQKQSADLQLHIFEQFQLINNRNEQKSVLQIFNEQKITMPPAGTGDCAAPKLLQYAFQQQLKPIALAEFWWGAPPKSKIRKHKQFYPPCSKCAPLLKHMLRYIEQEIDPINLQMKQPDELEIIFEDDRIIVINKPENFLSVPGKKQSDSVLQRLKQMRPKDENLLLVHRLDMATSGVLLAAKNMETYKIMQSQFIKRSVKKCYLAILDGLVKEDSGTVNLPLRVDLNNRPQQLVCYEHGKSASTDWEVIERTDGKTRVHFYPITGRTHQLRVHAAHIQGLNTPILGDNLYGNKDNRLYLHASSLEITHPKTGKEMIFHAKNPF